MCVLTMPAPRMLAPPAIGKNQRFNFPRVTERTAAR
jgi:hypothetical protein